MISEAMMVSTCNRLKLHYLGKVKVSQLVSSILVLSLIIWIFLYLRQPHGGIVREGPADNWVKQFSDADIKQYLRSMMDTRPDKCLNDKDIDEAEAGAVSIIVDFNEDQFYALKMTLQSIIAHTPDSLYKEIIVLDDGTTSPEVRTHAAKYMKAQNIHKLKGFRSDDYEGSSLARFKASKVAEGNTLVFLHSSVAVNEGWLSPLLQALHEDPHSIVVPHFDSFLSNYQFHRLPEHIVNIFSWTMTTLFVQGKVDQQGHLSSPAMSGRAFAVRKEFLEHLGSYDDHILQGGGENLELSIRTWLCGGSIRVIPCSRIAMKDALAPVVVTSDRNFRHIAELWLNEYKGVAYKQSPFLPGMSDPAKSSFQTRKSYLKRFVQCKAFSWYIQNVAADLVVPSVDSQQFGKLRARTAYCIRGTGSPGLKPVTLEHCRPNFYDAEMMFDWNQESQLVNSGNCLELGLDNSLVFVTCQADKKRQTWEYIPNQHVKSRARDDMCLTHVTTSPAPGQYEHELAVKKCADNNRHQQWSFVKP